MKQKLYALCVLLSSLAISSALAGDKTIEMKFASSKDTFLKGEPIIITCTLSNLSTNVIDMDLGFDRARSFLFSMEGSRQYTNSASYGGITLPPHVQLKSLETYSQPIILDEWNLPIRNGSNSISGCLDCGGVRLSAVFVVNLAEPSGDQLGVALGALVSRAATTTNIIESGILQRAIHTAAGRSPVVLGLLKREGALLYNILENIGIEPYD